MKRQFQEYIGALSCQDLRTTHQASARLAVSHMERTATYQTPAESKAQYRRGCQRASETSD